MKSILLVLLSFGLWSSSATAQDLMITGAIDGPLTGGQPKAIEFYVINDIPDLSIYGVGSANNGDPSEGLEFGFPAIAVTAGEFIYLADDSTGFHAWFGFPATYEDTSNATGINGDDVIELFMNGVLVDAIGNAGERPEADADWNFLDGWIYRNSNSSPSPTFTTSGWTTSGSNALDGLGDQTNDDAGEAKFPIGSYSGSVPTGLLSFNTQLASKIYPNPSKNGVFNVSFGSRQQDITLKVFNLVGDMVYSEEISSNKKQSTIRLTDLANGTYFLQVNDNFENKESYRLLKW